MPRGVYPQTKLIRPKQYPPELVTKVARLYAEGLTQTQVGSLVGVSQQVVCRVMRNHALAVRSHGPSYRSAHHRVGRVRGPASEHLCPCGTQATDWAYMHTDPDQIEGVTGRGNSTRAWFSVKPEHYEPRCRSCHTKMDKRAAGAAQEGEIVVLPEGGTA